MALDAPEIRVRQVNSAAPNRQGDFILYWMIAHRRAQWNFALDRAAGWSRRLGKPILVLEALRAGYRWASDRLHQFVIEGMADNAEAFGRRNIAYYPYLEPAPGDGAGLLESLASRAAVVITDDFPCFFLPHMVAAAGKRLPVLLEAVDSNGLYPLGATEEIFSSAHQFRRHLQKNLPPHLDEFPAEDALAETSTAAGATPPAATLKRWPMAIVSPMATRAVSLGAFPIDHAVAPVETRGGARAAQTRLQTFLDDRLARYAEERNLPEKDAASGLSPYLHFGHISVHAIFDAARRREGWDRSRLNPKPHGSREGWWRMAPALEAFLDELVTWRELGYHFCARVADYDQYETLPAWARATLDAHAADPRPALYTLSQFEAAQTHDELWNAAQRQLLQEGKIHNYLRMLWGKKILEWSPSPAEALRIMIELNNKYALDGRNPNSYTGICWTLGRFDRPWGPERPVFGTIRYMSSENTARKMSVKEYLRTYAAPPPLFSRAKRHGQ